MLSRLEIDMFIKWLLQSNLTILNLYRYPFHSREMGTAVSEEYLQLNTHLENSED
jgi:hypothetical protein